MVDVKNHLSDSNKSSRIYDALSWLVLFPILCLAATAMIVPDVWGGLFYNDEPNWLSLAQSTSFSEYLFRRDIVYYSPLARAIVHLAAHTMPDFTSQWYMILVLTYYFKAIFVGFLINPIFESVLPGKWIRFFICFVIFCLGTTMNFFVINIGYFQVFFIFLLAAALLILQQQANKNGVGILSLVQRKIYEPEWMLAWLTAILFVISIPTKADLVAIVPSLILVAIFIKSNFLRFILVAPPLYYLYFVVQNAGASGAKQNWLFQGNIFELIYQTFTFLGRLFLQMIGLFKPLSENQSPFQQYPLLFITITVAAVTAVSLYFLWQSIKKREVSNPVFLANLLGVAFLSLGFSIYTRGAHMTNELENLDAYVWVSHWYIIPTMMILLLFVYLVHRAVSLIPKTSRLQPNVIYSLVIFPFLFVALFLTSSHPNQQQRLRFSVLTNMSDLDVSKQMCFLSPLNYRRAVAAAPMGSHCRTETVRLPQLAGTKFLIAPQDEGETFSDTLPIPASGRIVGLGSVITPRYQRSGAGEVVLNIKNRSGDTLRTFSKRVYSGSPGKLVYFQVDELDPEATEYELSVVGDIRLVKSPGSPEPAIIIHSFGER